METETEFEATYREFIEGFADGIGFASIQDAEDQWSWVSRGLSNFDRFNLESGGYAEGLRQAAEFLKLFYSRVEAAFEKGLREGWHGPRQRGETPCTQSEP